MVKKDKIIATVTEDEIEDMKERILLRQAAKRILVDVEKGNEKWWDKMTKRYKLKKNIKYTVNQQTREIKIIY